MTTHAAKFILRYYTAVREVVTGLPWIRLAVALAVLLVAINIANSWNFSFSPFDTKGAIYVDSPEVYTRERLVNDRYDQDHWLRRRLRDLDETSHSATTRVEHSASAALGSNTNTESEGETKAQLNFAQEFEIATGLRDKIRQMMLENMLDDRHDLSGNSVYGFKFDTTVVPGDNTRKRAFVRVRTQIEPFFQTRDDTVAEGQLPSYLRAYLEKKGEDHARLEQYNQHYVSWLNNIENRLNSFVDNFYLYSGSACEIDPSKNESSPNDLKTLNSVTLAALEKVLSISPDLLNASLARDLDTSGLDAFLGEWIINTPAPWRNFFQIVRKKIKTSCGLRPRFFVREALDTIYLIKTTDQGTLPAWANTRFFTIRALEDGTHVTVSFDGQINDLDEYEQIQPRYAFPNELISEAKRLNALTLSCEGGKPPEGCPEENVTSALTVPAGLFTLIEQLRNQDAYSYAIFPRNESEGILSRRSLHSGLGLSEFPGGIDLKRTEDRSESRSVLVGFGDSRAAEDDAIEFGWVISPPTSGEPVQRTQMSLISVPAWVNEIVFHVTTGWLDGNAREDGESETHDVHVPLPPDFEAFDIVIWGGALDVRRRPIILDEFMDPKEGDIPVTACQKADILIPGSRLWRSTTVTLGGQRADKINVLPNMEGIIASFEKVQPIHASANDRLAPSSKRVLRVWTSEGVATSTKMVNVSMPASASESCGAADAVTARAQ